METIAKIAKKGAEIRERRRLHPYAVLLMSELGLILVYPFLASLPMGDEIFRLLAVIVFFTAIYAVAGRGRLTTIALILGAPAIVLRIVNIFHHRELVRIPDEVSGLVFLFFVTSVLVWSIVSNPSVTADTLAGAVSAYLLIGITFGLAYLLIESLVPGSFKDTVQPGKHFTPADFTFFSFVTLTTVGYGDIVPWGPHARSLAILESVLGIMYPAVLVSRLVGLHGRKREEEA
ncbi:MAG TPA: ion channel [Verrucomicrobiae bacterium]|nr:ion channel [Verrucomicrobiae bacterium]